MTKLHVTTLYLLGLIVLHIWSPTLYAAENAAENAKKGCKHITSTGKILKDLVGRVRVNNYPGECRYHIYHYPNYEWPGLWKPIKEGTYWFIEDNTWYVYTRWIDPKAKTDTAKPVDACMKRISKVMRRCDANGKANERRVSHMRSQHNNELKAKNKELQALENKLNALTIEVQFLGQAQKNYLDADKKLAQRKYEMVNLRIKNSDLLETIQRQHKTLVNLSEKIAILREARKTAAKFALDRLASMRKLANIRLKDQIGLTDHCHDELKGYRGDQKISIERTKRRMTDLQSELKTCRGY